MGLNLMAVNKNYGFNKDGDALEGNVEYSEVCFAYSSYKWLRDDFLKYLTDNSIASLEDATNYIGDYYITDMETYKVNVVKEDFEVDELSDVKVLEFLNKLEKLKIEFPKFYDCFAFIMHCDCEGEIPYEQLLSLFPHLKMFVEHLSQKEGKNKRLNSLVEVVNDAIDNKGKLYFT